MDIKRHMLMCLFISIKEKREIIVRIRVDYYERNIISRVGNEVGMNSL
jgi:hypothetical protein